MNKIISKIRSWVTSTSKIRMRVGIVNPVGTHSTASPFLSKKSRIEWNASLPSSGPVFLFETHSDHELARVAQPSRLRVLAPSRRQDHRPAGRLANSQAGRPALHSGSWVAHSEKFALLARYLTSIVLAVLVGCGTGKVGTKKDDFFTSGSREADQRASQTMAKHEQLTGSGEGVGEKGVKKAKVAEPHGDSTISGVTNKPAQVEGKLALFDRLGGEAGMSNIVVDFLPRAMQDPRVNWPRKGLKRGAWFHRNRGESAIWNASPENVEKLKKHLVQFFTLATGGAPRYEGKEIKSAHAGMRISNPEFDAAIGDLKASLDKLQIPNKEQKELLAIVESTRPQVVTQR